MMGLNPGYLLKPILPYKYYYICRRIFSISWISLGNYILLNVFLAIAVDNLSTEEDDEGEAADDGEKVNKQTNK